MPSGFSFCAVSCEKVMVLERLRQAVEKRTPMLVPEAGGNAALSFVHMLRKIYGNDLKLIAIDLDERVRHVYEAMGYEFIPEQQVTRALLLASFLLPTDEVFGNKTGISSPLAQSPLRKVMYNKFRCHRHLDAAHRQYVELPLLFQKVIVRGNSQSGGRGMLVHRSGPEPDGVLVTHHYTDAIEVQVDLIKTEEKLVFYPRITTRLHKGADTHVVLMGRKHPLYVQTFHATREIVNILEIWGIANIQFLVAGNAHRFLFLEAALRFSGSSWTNLFAGDEANPLLGNGFGEFEEIHATTQTGLGVIK